MAESIITKLPNTYSTPISSPMFVAPPYKYKGNRQVNVVFKTTPEAVASIVPAPLNPNPDSLVAVYYAMFKLVEPFDQEYNEVGISIPVAYNGIPGVYFAYMYLDSAPGIACGREIWGFPKKDAVITIEDKGGKSISTVTRMGTKLISATFEAKTKLSAIPPYPYRAFYNLKIIPSVSNVATPDVMQLTSIPIIRQSYEVYVGAGTVELSTSTFDPLGDIPILGIVHSQLDVHDMSLCSGEVAFDYLKQK